MTTMQHRGSGFGSERDEVADDGAGWLESEIVVPAQPGRSAGLRRVVGVLAGEVEASPRSIDDLQLVVSEVFAAVVPQGDETRFTIVFRREADAIELDLSVPAPARFELGTFAEAVVNAVGRPAAVSSNRVIICIPV